LWSIDFFLIPPLVEGGGGVLRASHASHTAHLATGIDPDASCLDAFFCESCYRKFGLCIFGFAKSPAAFVFFSSLDLGP
jgi:hypothetical protein